MLLIEDERGLLTDKEKALMTRAAELGCSHVATGHYARIEERDGEYFLKKALDPAKDQSYVLWSLTQEQLSHTLFPLGTMRKEEIRLLAERLERRDRLRLFSRTSRRARISASRRTGTTPR